jgi:hypothetical protein
VTLLIVGMIGLDVYFSEAEALKTTDIIENAQRSIILLDDIRVDARHMAEANDAQEIERWTRDIEEDSLKYDPMATYTR